MVIYNEDIIVALSMFNRLKQERELLIQFGSGQVGDEQTIYLGDRLKKFGSECLLIGLSEINGLLNLLSLFFELKGNITPDTLIHYKTLSELLYQTLERAKDVLTPELNSGKDNIELHLLSEKEKQIIEQINLYIKSYNTENEFRSDYEMLLSGEKYIKEQLNSADNGYYPLFEQSLVLFNEHQDNENYLIMFNHFSRYKAGIDLLTASLNDDLPEKHPLMQLSALCSAMETLFEKFSHLDTFSPVLFTLIQSGCSKIKDLQRMINQEVSPGLIVSELIGEIHLLIKEAKKKSLDQQVTDPVREALFQNPVLITDPAKIPEEGYIRIRQDALENITNLITELIVSNSSISYIQNKLRSGDDLVSVIQALQNTEKSFQRVISDLDGLIMTLRLQKLKELFQRFPRLVRELAKNQGKKINFEISGEDLELDNIIMKQLADPLMHIIRNSCDHGIEEPEIRKKRGKEETGLIRVSAGIIGSKMLITVYDDGNGLSVEKIRQKAIEKGIMPAADLQLLSEQQVFNLILLPGFSTAEKVTEISGRGVGMDVVQQNISKVKGHIQIDSRVHEFTRIQISLPITLTISKGLLVMVRQEHYLIPLEYVVSIQHIKNDEIHRFKEGFFIKYHEQFIGLCYLKDVLDGTQKDFLSEKDTLLAVVLDVELIKRGLVIDKVIGIQEISIRMLPESLKQLDVYRGCATMSDGRAVLVLNPKKLFKE